MKITQKILVISTLLIGLLVRTYKLDSPIADWHSFRQADTASVTRNLLNHTGSFFKPTYHDYSNIQSGLDNPKGYRMVELPIYNFLSASVFEVLNPIISTLDIETISRLISITLSLLSSYIIFLFVQKQTGLFLPSFFSMAFFLLLPFNIFYSRTILPESTAVFFMVLGLYLFPISPPLAGLPLALSVLTKPYTLLILFPTLLVLSFLKFKKLSLPAFFQLLIFSLITLAPFLAWRFWIRQFPEGIPVNKWLFNEGGMRFRPAWFRWLYFERIGKLILGAYGTMFIPLGLALKKNRIQLVSFSLLAGILIYFSVIARGNIQHDYYQSLIIPQLSIIIGLGAYYFYKILFKNKLLSLTALTLFSLFSLSFSWYQVQEYYKINNPVIIEAGQQIDKIVPKDSLLIAPYNGDTAFLYQSNRSGWPIEIYDIDNIKNQHPGRSIYFASVNFDDYTNNLLLKYDVLFKNEKFIILDLNNEIKN
ncbi:MAG: ArnT family glycosyltransferase [Patescibacteria group bacterium]|jgi:hypothetical protein